MRIIAKSTLRRFWEERPDAQQPLLAWYIEASRAEWETPADVKAQYRNASIVGDGRVVFKVKGNDYRLVVRINYERSTIYIRFIGSHRDYDKVDVETI
jgi:mRNA interferase HigB